jgi:hypothetical protein
MQPHQQRVVEEKTELDGKIERLTAFLGGDLFKTLDGAEQERLTRQVGFMRSYSGVLGERIAAF